MIGFAVGYLIEKTDLDPSFLSNIILGNVVPFLKGPNIAREVIFHLNLPGKISGYTISAACISGLRAVTSAMEEIKSGKSELIIAGGVESISNMPVTYRETFIRSMFKARREKSPFARLYLFAKANPLRNFFPEIPQFQEHSTGLKMGDYAEMLAEKFDISRQAMDEFALQSHRKAARATKEGKYKSDIIKLSLPTGEEVDFDTTIREDTSVEKLSELRPAFKKDGRVTAGNASPPTDGAAVVLLASEKMVEKGFTPQARIKDYAYATTNNREELLLGSAYAISELLRAENLSLSDIDVFELHEAFASQVIATIKCLNAEPQNPIIPDFLPPEGRLEESRLNLYGGSISLGHPFSATGIRLIMNAVNALKEIKGNYAVVASCAAGGLGAALLIENID